MGCVGYLAVMLLNYLIDYKLRNNYLTFFSNCSSLAKGRPCALCCLGLLQSKIYNSESVHLPASLLPCCSLVIAQRCWEVWGADAGESDLGAKTLEGCICHRI